MWCFTVQSRSIKLFLQNKTEGRKKNPYGIFLKVILSVQWFFLVLYNKYYIQHSHKNTLHANLFRIFCSSNGDGVNRVRVNLKKKQKKNLHRVRAEASERKIATYNQIIEMISNSNNEKRKMLTNFYDGLNAIRQLHCHSQIEIALAK